MNASRVFGLRGSLASRAHPALQPGRQTGLTHGQGSAATGSTAGASILVGRTDEDCTAARPMAIARPSKMAALMILVDMETTLDRHCSCQYVKSEKGPDMEAM